MNLTPKYQVVKNYNNGIENATIEFRRISDGAVLRELDLTPDNENYLCGWADGYTEAIGETYITC